MKYCDVILRCGSGLLFLNRHKNSEKARLSAWYLKTTKSSDLCFASMGFQKQALLRTDSLLLILQKTTVLSPTRKMRSSENSLTALTSTLLSISLPTAINSGTVTAWFTVATSCTMIGPSSSPPKCSKSRIIRNQDTLLIWRKQIPESTCDKVCCCSNYFNSPGVCLVVWLCTFKPR